MAGVMMAAGVDAAGYLQLQFAQFPLPAQIGETLADFLSEGDRARVGEAAIVEAGAGDAVGYQVEIGGCQTSLIELLPERV